MSKLTTIPITAFTSKASMIKKINDAISNKNVKCINFNIESMFKGVIEIISEEPQIIKVPYAVQVEKVVEVEVPVEKVVEVVKEVEVPLKIVNQVKKQKGATSQYRGVSRKNGKWNAMIQHEGKKYWCGSFFHELEAAEAYDKKAFELKGKDAILNFDIPYNITNK